MRSVHLTVNLCPDHRQCVLVDIPVIILQCVTCLLIWIYDVD